MFQGLRTGIYHVDDIEQAKAWYTSVVGFGPYFDQPFYVGFNVGGYELGLQPREKAPTCNTPTVVVYWGVDDTKAALARLLSLGAHPNDDVQDVGEGILVATVRDPWSNILGIIENPHFSLPAATPEQA